MPQQSLIKNTGFNIQDIAKRGTRSNYNNLLDDLVDDPVIVEMIPTWHSISVNPKMIVPIIEPSSQPLPENPIGPSQIQPKPENPDNDFLSIFKRKMKKFKKIPEQTSEKRNLFVKKQQVKVPKKLNGEIDNENVILAKKGIRLNDPQ